MSALERLAGVVAPEVLLDAIRLTLLLAELGVPHVLVGGLAVGLNGRPRATKDVDFLVGPEAFERTEPMLVYREELKELIHVGVIDLLAVPEAYPVLAEQLRIPEPGELPVIALEALVLMKLHANRPHDRADVDGLLRTSGLRRLIEDYLGNHAPHLLERMVGLGD